MDMSWSGRLVARLLMGGAVALCLFPFSASALQAAGPSANVSVVATGLNAPRGLTFGPDGNLYVAEAGSGGTYSTAGRAAASYGPCKAAPPEPGPAFGGYSGRISEIDAQGHRTDFITNLPSTKIVQAQGPPLLIGPADVKFINGVMYGLLDAGCANGNPDVPSGVLQIAPNGTWSEYDLSLWQYAHPPAQPDVPDYTPDGTWYSLVGNGTMIYTVNPNSGQIVAVDPWNATVRQVVDMSASLGHIVPTSLASGNGKLYVANLGTFPITPGTEKIWQVSPDTGQVTVVASGLTMVEGLVVDSKGTLYALEGSTAPGNPTPGTGAVVRVNSNGSLTTVASGLTFPTAMTTGPDGNLYVSNVGYGPDGTGQIVKVTLGGS